jgi:Domain of unknown function (DUF4157)/Putative RNase-like toxin, toxin_1
MTRQTSTQKQPQTPTISLLSRGNLLQRKCVSCGQHTIAGGECSGCAKTKVNLQRKLTIGASNDPLELEADRVADQVMAAPTHPAVGSAPPRIQRFTGQAAGQVEAAPASVDHVLSSPGRLLERSLQQDMGQRFGHDFSRVRVHTDAAAERSAQDVNANAYTVGQDIVFGAGRFAPGTISGRRLIAHELTHVVQQSRSGLSSGINGGYGLESEAEHAPHEVVRGGSVVSVSGASDIRIARDAKPSEQVLYEVKFPDGIKRLTAAEFESQKQEAVRRLRSRLNLIAQLAEVGRNSQIDMLKEYHGGVESLTDVIRKPKALIGIASDIKAGVTPPYIGMWSHAVRSSQNAIAALDRGDIREGARLLQLADTHYRDSMREWNAYREATIGGAEAVASNLETVRDVSFAIALVAGAAVAAPVVAGAVGAGGLGLTGATATGATALGTAGSTGLLGAGLGGGSTALASYTSTGKVDVNAAVRDAKKFGKQGAVTGLTAGLGSALGASGKAAELAKPLVQQALKRCLTEAGVNVAGEVTTAALDKVLPEEPIGHQPEGKPQAPQALLPGPARAVLTGCISGALGVPVGKLGSGVARKGADLAVGAGVSYADARLSGQDSKAALAAVAQSTLTSGLIQHAEQPNGSRPAKKNTETHTQSHDTPAKVNEPTSKSNTIGSDETPKTPISEKVAGQIKGSAVEDIAPAILKEDAIAKKPTADGHDAVVTKQGVAKCSPSPCPVIHVEYAKELAEFPELKKMNDEIQAMRKTDPEKASVEAAALIATLEAARSNKTKNTSGENGGAELSFGLHIGEKRAEQIRSGEKDFPIDRVLEWEKSGKIKGDLTRLKGDLQSSDKATRIGAEAEVTELQSEIDAGKKPEVRGARKGPDQPDYEVKARTEPFSSKKNAQNFFNDRIKTANDQFKGQDSSGRVVINIGEETKIASKSTASESITQEPITQELAKEMVREALSKGGRGTNLTEVVVKAKDGTIIYQGKGN